MLAVLFDLDGTLLDLDIGDFLERYFRALGDVASELVGPRAAPAVLRAVLASTDAMCRPHAGRSNREVFHEDFRRRTGIDLEEAWPVFERFYREDFPALGDGASGKAGARRSVTTALDLGLGVAIATNPIFPRVAIDHRIAWAGLSDLPVTVVTSYEVMHATKPLPAYFIETAEILGVQPADCLMVGDDAGLDLPAGGVGMRTFLVGRRRDTSADFFGDLDDVAELLPRLAAERGEKDSRSRA